DGIRDRNVTGVQTCALPISAGGTVFEATDKGIYRSNDNGDQWSYAGPDTVAFRFLAIAPDGALFAASEKNGIYRSLDGGATWLEIGRASCRERVEMEGCGGV